MYYRLIKSEPNKYSRDDFVRDGRTSRDGVRNFLARNNLREMRVGDRCFRYHSNIGKEIIGVVEIVREAYPDPTAVVKDGEIEKGEWVAVDVVPVVAFEKPVTLEMIKGESALADMELLRLSRLSVGKVKEEERKRVLEMGNK
jgi:predicted RNA-binding protein with PUA-like domain